LYWIGGFNNTARIAFSGRQNEEKLLIEIHEVFIQKSHDPSKISLSGHQKVKHSLFG
jgi:membrane carboxypeptidase/penicillin-binding protein PbpC